MNQPSFNDLTDALSAPIGDLIASIGQSMADAQQSLDEATIENFKSIYNEDQAAFEALRKIGYQPTWYQIPEVNAEVNMALTVSGSQEESGKKGGAMRLPGRSRIRLYGMPVDATFTNKYGFKYEAASKVQFKIVPIPPSPAAEGMRVSPMVTGLSLEAAEQILQDLNIDYRLHDDAPESPEPSTVVAGQSVDPGEIIPGNDTLILSLEF